MRLLWLCVGVAVTVAVTTGQGQVQQGQTGQTGSQEQQGQTGQTGSQEQQGQTGQTGSQTSQGQNEQSGQQESGKGQGGGGGTKGCIDKLPQKLCTRIDDKGECYTLASSNLCRNTCKLCDLECRDLKHWMYCGDMKTKGKCSVSVLSNLCRKTCNLCDCADKKSAEFCSRVRTQRNCKNWGLAQHCKRSCDLCGRSAPRNDKQYHCQVSGDPHLKKYDGESASIPFPCLYRVADLLINISSTTRFSFLRIEVQASSSMETFMERFFVSNVEVYLTVYDGTIDNLTQVHTAYFKTSEDMINSYLEDPYRPTWKLGGHGVAVKMVEAGYDFESSQAFLQVFDGSPSILFRPVNRQGKMPQKMRPGLYIDVGDDVIKQNTVQFPYSLCSNTDDTRKLGKLASDLKLNKRQFLLHTVLSQNLKQSNSQCTRAVSTYQNCGVPSHKALTKCEPHLNMRNVGCLAKLNAKAFDVFLACLQFRCNATDYAAAVKVYNLSIKLTRPCRRDFPNILH